MQSGRAIMEDNSSQFIKKKKIACSVEKKKKNVIFAMPFIKLKIFLSSMKSGLDHVMWSAQQYMKSMNMKRD